MSKNKETINIWSLLSKIPKLILSEVTTTFGRVNLISDLVLAAVVISIFTVDTIERVAIIFASIFNDELTQHISNAEPLIAFIILVVFFAACLSFVYFSEKIIHRAK